METRTCWGTPVKRQMRLLLDTRMKRNGRFAKHRLPALKRRKQTEGQH